MHLNCPFCKEEDCVEIIVITYTETTAMPFKDNKQLGFDLRDEYGEIIPIDFDSLHQDLKFNCFECDRDFKFKKNYKVVAYNETEIFDKEEANAFLNGDETKFIEIQ